jgi:transcriptional regulator with XRE-family HTH domain
MVNDRLHEAVRASGLKVDEIARRLGVDPKTVGRWIAGRVPYPRHRRALAGILSVDESALWPQTVQRTFSFSDEGTAKVRAVYAHRWAVPRNAWLRLFASAEQEIGILAYAALFLAEDDGMLRVLAERARAGVRIRMLLGDPTSRHVAERGTGEGIGDAISAKVRNSLALYQSLTEIEGVEIRLHDTTLYASIYRADEDVLINAHAYGVPASHAPVIHVQHARPGDMAEVYLESFDRVWNEAKAYEERDTTQMPAADSASKKKEPSALRNAQRALPMRAVR